MIDLPLLYRRPETCARKERMAAAALTLAINQAKETMERLEAMD